MRSRLILAVLLFSAVWGCTRQPPVEFAWPGGLGAQIRECPKSGIWTTIFENKQRFPGVATGGQLSVPGIITDVPEFHDCQAFIIQRGTGRSYLTLFAIFARSNLRDVTARYDSILPRDSLHREADTARVLSARGPVAVGEIVALQDGYPVLGIQPGFNCVVLDEDINMPSGMTAKMVPVAGDEQKCKDVTYLQSATGKILEVYRTPFSSTYVPAVARWDWDPVNNQHHIGIACGSAWCDVGRPGFTPSKAHLGGVVAAGDQVHAVKGWYDEQTLAFPLVGGGLTVGTAFGAIMPMPDLGDDTGDPETSRYLHTWIKVATAALDNDPGKAYLKKLNIEKTKFRPSTVAVWLCHGASADCIPSTVHGGPKCSSPTNDWWARVDAAASTKTAYFCVTRVSHAGITIPGTVRWRWSAKDETMWIRCLEGCCEVEAESIALVVASSVRPYAREQRVEAH